MSDNRWQDWCDHCSGDLSQPVAQANVRTTTHILCETCYRRLDADEHARALASVPEGERQASCLDCKRLYGSEHGFPDLIIPYWAWKRISPTEDDGGLLCPSCICKRLHDAKISCEGAFLSGPIKSVSAVEMEIMRGLENIELALNGRQNGVHEGLEALIKKIVSSPRERGREGREP